MENMNIRKQGEKKEGRMVEIKVQKWRKWKRRKYQAGRTNFTERK